MLQRFDIATLPAVPWKNGGGSTREIVRRPEGAGMDAFDWRVSIATIAQAGPFSAFAGVERSIMLLEGDGVLLQEQEQGVQHRLDRPLVPFVFSGDAALDCTLLGGISTDFNLMLRRSRLRGALQVLRATQTLPSAEHGLLLCLCGRWQANAERLDSGQGLWWDGSPRAWNLQPQAPDAAVAWVRLQPFVA